jgi:hypothetical protein
VSPLVSREAVQDMTVEAHITVLILQRATNAINEGAFAGAVWTDQAETLARLNLKLHTIKRDKAAKTLADVVDVQ